MSRIQSVRFDRRLYTTDMARKWLRSHGIEPLKRVDKTARELRYRIEPPENFRRHRIKKTSVGISFVIGFP